VLHQQATELTTHLPVPALEGLRDYVADDCKHKHGLGRRFEETYLRLVEQTLNEARVAEGLAHGEVLYARLPKEMVQLLTRIGKAVDRKCK
jgi:hypothetical protein